MGEEASPIPVSSAPASALPHLLLICFPGQGHVNPMLRLAKRIAAKGLLVTFSSTCDAGDKLVASAGVSAGGDGVPVGQGRLRFQFMDDGYHGTDLDELMRHLATTGRVEFAALLRRQAEDGRPVTCVVVNPFMPWAVDVAGDAGIPSAVLWVQSCTVFSLYHHHVHGLVEFPAEDDLDTRFTLPGLPPLSVADVPSFLLPSNPYKLLVDTIITQFRTIDKATWVLVNSFTELEPDVVAALPGVTPRPPELIPVGPLIEASEDDRGVRGDMIKAADDCVEWLDAQAAGAAVRGVRVGGQRRGAVRGGGRGDGARAGVHGPTVPVGRAAGRAAASPRRVPRCRGRARDGGAVEPAGPGAGAPVHGVLPHALRVELDAGDDRGGRARGGVPAVGRPVHGRPVPRGGAPDGRPAPREAEQGRRARGRGSRRGRTRRRGHAGQRQEVERGVAGRRGARWVVGRARAGVRGRGEAASKQLMILQGLISQKFLSCC